jgi:hypothetical protein
MPPSISSLQEQLAPEPIPPRPRYTPYAWLAIPQMRDILGCLTVSESFGRLSAFYMMGWVTRYDGLPRGLPMIDYLGDLFCAVRSPHPTEEPAVDIEPPKGTPLPC